jgi:hypothetical protein
VAEILGVAVLDVDNLLIGIFMKEYENIFIAAKDLSIFESNEWLFINKENWNTSPNSAKVYMMTDDEMMDLVDAGEAKISGEGIIVADIFSKQNIEEWIDTQTLEGVLINIKKNNVKPSNEIIIKAINHYLEYDDFLE